MVFVLRHGYARRTASRTSLCARVFVFLHVYAVSILPNIAAVHSPDTILIASASLTTLRSNQLAAPLRAKLPQYPCPVVRDTCAAVYPSPIPLPFSLTRTSELATLCECVDSFACFTGLGGLGSKETDRSRRTACADLLGVLLHELCFNLVHFLLGYFREHKRSQLSPLAPIGAAARSS